MTRILILTASYGDGHNTAAFNLCDALRSRDPHVEVEVVDLLRYSYGWVDSAACHCYHQLLNCAPRIWGSLFRALDRAAQSSRTVTPLARAGRHLAELLQSHRPHCVISTYPAYTALMHALARDGRRRPCPFGVVITDSVTIHAAWYVGSADFFCVPNAETAAVLAADGVEPHRIHPFGFPVSARFAAEADPANDWEPGQVLRLLYVLNHGTRKAVKTVRRLLRLPDVHLTVVAGRSERLRAKVWHATVGHRKEPALVRLLDEVIEQRATLILNGDFLELMHESYGAIKRSYREVFARLPSVRRIIYVPGNHDEEVVRDRIKEVRRSTRRRAERHAYASARRDANGGVRLEPRAWAVLHPRLQAWRDALADPRLATWLEEVLGTRQGSLQLSHGFAEEGVAFQRGGPRDTPDERPVWYLDDSTLREADPAARILKLVADRRQRLDRVISSEWGGRVRIAPYHFDPARRVYFEHGHAAVPSCNGSWLGPTISRLGGWLKRCGLTQIEHLVEERIGRHVRAIYPFGRVREMNQFIERALAVATWLVHGEKITNPALFFGHTHEPAAVTAHPVHAFTTRLVGASYGNTGAWSSRLRSPPTGADQVEWLEWDACGRAQARAEQAAPSPPINQPSSSPCLIPADGGESDRSVDPRKVCRCNALSW